MIAAVSMRQFEFAMIEPIRVAPLVEPWIGLLIIPSAVAALVLGLRLLPKSGTIHPESVRKLLHIGGGLISLSLPWLFDNVWPLLVLAGAGAAALIAFNAHRRRAARSEGLMAGVERQGEVYIGPIYFPLAVVILFWLARGNVLLYAIPLVVLTFADAVAALVGVRYGKLKYEATKGRKSLEGSTAFFLAAFFSVHVPLLLLTDLGRAETLLIGITFGLLLTMVEAIAWSGLDNLFIPVIGFLLLKVFVGLNAEQLIWRLIVTGGLAGVAWFARGRSWNDAALILAVLVGYVCANLGGVAWLLIALLTFAGVAWMSPAKAETPTRTVREVAAVSCVGLTWLALAHELQLPELLGAFTGSLAAHLAMNGVARSPREASPRSVVGRVALSGAWLLGSFVLLSRGSLAAWVGAAGAAVGLTVTAILFAKWLPQCETRFGDRGRWWLQTLLAGAASMGGLAVFLIPG
jgi:phytol kinase